MAGLLTLVISFLARIAGLGRVSDAVADIVNRIRAPIDRALDRVVEWIVAQARRLGRFIAQAGVPADPRERLRLGLDAAAKAVNRFAGRKVGAAVLTPLLGAIRLRYGFQALDVFQRGQRWWVRGQVNPPGDKETEAQAEGAGTTPENQTPPTPPTPSGAFGSPTNPFQILWHKPPIARYPDIALTVDPDTGEQKTVGPLQSTPFTYPVPNAAAMAQLGPISAAIGSIKGKLDTRSKAIPTAFGVPGREGVTRADWEADVTTIRQGVLNDLADAEQALEAYKKLTPEQKRLENKKDVNQKTLERAVSYLKKGAEAIKRRLEVPGAGGGAGQAQRSACQDLGPFEDAEGVRQAHRDNRRDDGRAAHEPATYRPAHPPPEDHREHSHARGIGGSRIRLGTSRGGPCDRGHVEWPRRILESVAAQGERGAGSDH